MKQPLPKRILKIFLIAFLLVWTLFPIYWMLSLSIRSGSELTGA